MFYDHEFDNRLRSAAFAYLRVVQLRTGGPVRLADVNGFEFDGERISLMDPQRGIRKPRRLAAALSIRTTNDPRPDRQIYKDEDGSDGFPRYQWRGDDPNHPENVALRIACELRLPLVWFRGFAQGLYLPSFPVYLASEERSARQFVVVPGNDLAELMAANPGVDSELRRSYATRTVNERMHQPIFRARVLNAYGLSCAICSLRHSQLLDAAHIRSDADGGEPIVPNGISMCKIHHAAYDSDLLGISPDYRVEMRSDLLDEVDGPTLRHTFQGLHLAALHKPVQRLAWPDRELLEERFDRFKRAS